MYLHCHSCDWEQDDFWTRDYNPLTKIWSNIQWLAKPRMMDFAVWLVAAESALPWNEGEFERVYARNRSAADVDAVDASAIGPVLLAFLTTHGDYEGTPSDLLERLVYEVNGPPGDKSHSTGKTKSITGWPNRARDLGTQLKGIAPNLRRLGFTVELEHRTRKARGSRPT